MTVRGDGDGDGDGLAGWLSVCLSGRLAGCIVRSLFDREKRGLDLLRGKECDGCFSPLNVSLNYLYDMI